MILENGIIIILRRWNSAKRAGQMNTVFSWGTCKKSGIIKNIGRAKIC